MRTYLSVENDFSGELAAGLGWLDKEIFSLEEAAFSPAVAPPPLPLRPPLLLASFSSPGTAQACLHREKQPFSLKMSRRAPVIVV